MREPTAREINLADAASDALALLPELMDAHEEQQVVPSTTAQEFRERVTEVCDRLVAALQGDGT